VGSGDKITGFWHPQLLNVFFGAHKLAMRGATRIYHFTLGFDASMVVNHIIGTAPIKSE
jgi:hypothetical protein